MNGERVVFLEDFEFNNKLYKKGHQFTIVGEDIMRGYDLKDDWVIVFMKLDLLVVSMSLYLNSETIN